MDELFDKAKSVKSHDDLVCFLEAYIRDFKKNPNEWENVELMSFLEAFAAWCEDMSGYYSNKGEKMPEQPNWQTISDMFMGARIYE